MKRRVDEHKLGFREGFTKRYNIKLLVYFEEFSEIRYAIEREKQLKGWLRSKKVKLIEKFNPNWGDLSEDL